ncbi:MAG: hypothetical protein ACHP7N_01245 [Caulobacterales bacterium]
MQDPMSTPGEKGRDADTPDKVRVVARLSSEYVLRALRLLGDLQGGDILAGIISQAIVAANTAHLDLGAGRSNYAGVDDTPPDELRKPISVLALSGSLGLPFETTRRYVNKLLKSGRCKRVKGGLIVPASMLNDSAWIAAGQANLINVRRLMRNLRSAGVAAE